MEEQTLLLFIVNGYREGFVDVRNPFNKHQISRISFSDVDLIFFCTKNPLPILPYLKEIKKPILFHVTLTSYQNDIEPNVIDKKKIIEGIKEISQFLGKEYVYIRYDPILLNSKYTISYHIKAFSKLCRLLDGYVEHVIVSFIDDYKNVRKNINTLQLKDFTLDDYKQIGIHFSSIAKEHHMTVQTCFEENTLEEYGFIKEDCLSSSLAYQLTGKKFGKWKARKENKCDCVQMVDIGTYNTCSHLCKYCYANFLENQVESNKQLHNPSSSLLIGELEEGDIVTNRIK